MTLRWWQEGVIYQVVVLSFMDSNDDGEGDLNGVRERLDYLSWLGVGAIWLSPFYPSPMVDLGYDVADYQAVNARFGSIEDFDALLAAAHERGIKVILDWVPNHTSDVHPWFSEARASRGSPRRDWYLWRDAKDDGSPPTNWISVFGGSAWQWDEGSGQYYYHSFLESQPDLNWRNPAVREAVFEGLRFWLRRGVDGFRIDAASWLIKDSEFRDNPHNPYYRPEKDGPDQQVVPLYTWDQPEVHGVLAEFRRVVDEFEDRLLVGELVLPIESILTYYGEREAELHLPLNMHLAWTDWTSGEIGRVIEAYNSGMPAAAWPTYTASTHDFSRLAARLWGEQTRIAAMLLLTLGGTPTLYYGEELGMRGVDIPPDQALDPQGRRIGRNRDPARTPMQWEAAKGAGFTKGTPWLPIGDDLEFANVTAQRSDDGSLLNLYRSLIELRRQHYALLAGTFELISSSAPLLAYRRRDLGEHYLVVLNMAGEDVDFPLGAGGRASLVLSTFLDRTGERVENVVGLRGNEGVILRFEGSYDVSPAG